MKCIPENDLHTEECIKGMAPCDGFRCSVCGTMLPGDLQGNPNPTMCHECANGYVGATHREMDAVKASVNYSEPQSNDSYTHETESNYAAIDNSQTETIDITPRGCETAEGAKHVDETMKAFTESRENVARVATSFARTYGHTILAQLGHVRMFDEVAELTELIVAVEERLKAEDAFVRAVAGR